MGQAICIIHHRGSSPWLADLLNSIETDYPIIITNHDGWCTKAIKETFERTTFDEIVFFNETMLVKDNAIWDIIFKQYNGQSVALATDFLMFFGKYLRTYVEQTSFPDVRNKADDVLLGENGWNQQYRNFCGPFASVDPLHDTAIFEERHGRENMVLENDYFIKYKSCWNLDMVQRLHPS